MAIQFIVVKCPQCGCDLSIEEGRSQAFCTYCGAKVLIHNENEYIYRHIDEAGIKKAETERMIELKKLEQEREEARAREEARKKKMRLSIILGIAGSILFMIGASGPSNGNSVFSFMGFLAIIGAILIWRSESEEHKNKKNSDMLDIPQAVYNFERINYSTVREILEKAGFTNISCLALNDLTFGILTKPGTVGSITINGKNMIIGKKYHKDSAIVITYHSIN